MKGNFYTIVYSVVLGVVCALLLTAAATFTKPYKTANREAEEMFNILFALNIPLPQDVSSQQMVEIFNENIRDERGDGKVYLYSPQEADGEVEAIALRFSGPGLWGPIKGFLALESDKRTIRGVTFYEQEETPGLGGEIVSSSFRDQFKGKSIVDAAGKAGMIVKAGSGKLSNGVDGITGATMTCDKLQEMLNDVIKSIVEETD